ncbi:MAG: response regulator [Blastocatellia bacterium]|nr:response regulator [Blastocatellia bacterium]
MTDRKYRILIAEDFEDNRIALKLMLKMAGFDPLEAEDGQRAVELVREQAPDLVLMDISLPILDGLQATRAIRAEAAFQRLPIIIVSAYDNEETRAQARQAGGTDYISKPIEFDNLKSIILRHLAAAGVEPVR